MQNWSPSRHSRLTTRRLQRNGNLKHPHVEKDSLGTLRMGTLSSSLEEQWEVMLTGRMNIEGWMLRWFKVQNDFAVSICKLSRVLETASCGHVDTPLWVYKRVISSSSSLSRKLSTDICPMMLSTRWQSFKKKEKKALIVKYRWSTLGVSVEMVLSKNFKVTRVQRVQYILGAPFKLGQRKARFQKHFHCWLTDVPLQH